MDNNTCSMCNIEKHVNNFYKRYADYKDCSRTRGLNLFYENKDKISKRQKVCNEKVRDRLLLQKQNNRCIHFKDLVLSYVEIIKNFKALEKN